ncbi:MAG: response regulator transcription factor [Fluviicola sp.]|nr:response regulator transcription factor [Fluviicola sp.]
MKIVIADDHPIFRSGLKFLLESSFEKVHVTDFDNGASVLLHLESNTPDLVFLDIDMPQKNGLDTCAEIAKLFPQINVVILSMYKDVEMVKLAFFSGAKGYLVKDNTSEELVECVLAIQQGKSYLAKDIRDPNRQELSENSDQLHIAELLNTLTQTELKVLKLVSQKYSSKEIANLLFVSVKSVENYRSRICKKLNLDARNNSLLMWVMENKSVVDRKDQQLKF